MIKKGLSEKEFLRQFNPAQFDRCIVTVDAVIFSVSREEAENYRKAPDRKLAVLLVKRNDHPFMGRWSLPGGFVAAHETFDASVKRVLKTKTGLDNIYIEQLYTFDRPERDPRMRIVSGAYLSLIDRSKYQEELGKWFSISQEKNTLILSSSEDKIAIKLKKTLEINGRISNAGYAVQQSPLAFDHGDIILEGLLRLRNKLEYTDIVFNLTGDTFTLGELQRIYETILGLPLLTADFRRRISAKIESTGLYTQGHGHRPSQLFRYKRS
jgi:ADP-ribose pyrophosphatase YjhB (NUDIX family)